MHNKLFVKLFFFTFLNFISLSFYSKSYGQNVKPGINFQAVARDKAGNPANNRKIYVEASILNGATNGIVVYGEHHESTSNEYGVFNIVIGKGSRYMGVNDIYGIDWASANFYFHLRIAITPISPTANWEYNKEWIDIGTVEFGVVPYALQALSTNGAVIDPAILSTKLNVADTATILSPYALKVDLLNWMTRKINIADSFLYTTPYQLAQKTFDTTSLSNRINARVNYADTNSMLTPYLKRVQLAEYINPKLNILDTAAMLNARFTRDTSFLSNRINLKENLANKSVDIGLIADYNDVKYPSVKAIKDYVDAALIAGAPDATTNNKGIVQLSGDLTGSAAVPLIAGNTISTIKLQDAAVTDAKLASGISSTKVGLGNVTNNAQLYNLNGLTAQIQNFGTPATAGLLPNWISSGSNHILNIPMASASAVTAGLISKLEYDHFTTAFSNSINSITNNGNNGVASISSNVLNIPAYSLIGLAGNVNANTIFSGPNTGAAGPASFRALVSADIPNNAANTTGNAATANKLRTAVNINNVSFDGTSDITTLTAITPSNLSFNNNGLGAISGSTFNGSSSKEISYNTIGAAPAGGSVNIIQLGTVTTGDWAANVIGSNYGGAGNVAGILKANGVGVVSAAIAGTDYQTGLTFSSPILNTSNTISIPQANNVNSGYLTNTDWASFNNKIDLSQKASINGVASLDANGKIPTTQIPSISFSSGYVVTSQSAMLALSSAVVGSIAIRTDNSKNYVLSGLPATTLANWLELLMPVSVSSVNGHTESNITLTTTDIAEGANLYFTNTNARNAISATSPLVYNASTGVVSIPAANTSVPGYLTASDWTLFNSKIGAFTAQAPSSFYAGPSSGINAIPTFRGIVVADIPTLNQNTTGNAATATKLVATKNINGVPFDGSSNITITSNVSAPITFDDSGAGGITTTTFNGSVTKIISYNTIGAAPALGSNAIVTLGSITTGTWLGTVIDAFHGGAGNINGILKANGSGTVSAAVGGSDFENPLTFSTPLSRASNTISLSAATTTSNGYLTSTDWNLFNGKQSSIVGGTGVTISGGNTVSIGQSVASSASPTFTGATITGLNVAGIVTNTAGGLLGTASTTGSGNIVRATSPTLVTPVLGDASATSLSTGTMIASSDVTAKRYKLTMPSNITATATTNIDLSTGNVFTVNMGLNITTFTFTNPGVGTYLIKFVQDATGTRDITFPAAWKWAGGVIPSLTNTANKLDIVTLIYDGTTYYATIVQNF